MQAEMEDETNCLSPIHTSKTFVCWVIDPPADPLIFQRRGGGSWRWTQRSSPEVQMNPSTKRFNVSGVVLT